MVGDKDTMAEIEQLAEVERLAGVRPNPDMFYNNDNIKVLWKIW